MVDIRWFVENDKAGGYNQTDPIYVYDEYGRYTPALNRFPSAANGVGFKALADYVHGLGLKFGIHIMRGLPKIAAEKKLPVKGTNGITCDMIASNDSACTWLRDNYKVDYRKPGAQEYYNSIFDLYAQWGVDFVKVDDLSRPYHTAEIEMIRHAIDQCGRPIVLSISPGETPLNKMEHVKNHANMWRTVDDFWDNWSQLNYQFNVCAKWAPYIAPGTWPDADMLPLGKISIRGERGEERWTNFTTDEQYTMMNLWTIFKSPLMFGGDLPQNDEATNKLLTDPEVLYMHHYSANNRQLNRNDNRIVWAADDPANGDKFVAVDVAVEGLDDAAADRVVLGAVGRAPLLDGDAGDGRGVDALIREHGGKVFKGEHAVHDAALARLALFGDAGADEHDFGVGVLFADHFGVRDHGRIDGREVLQRLRVIQRDHGVDGGAAGGDEVLEGVPFEQFFILRRHFARADARLLRVGEAQPAQREAHDVEVLQAEAGHEGGRDGGDDLAAREQALHLLPLAVHAFGVLRADLGAVAAEDAAAVDDLGVVVDHLDRLDGAFAQAFITVFAARVFEIEITDHISLRAPLILRADRSA